MRLLRSALVTVLIAVAVLAGLSTLAPAPASACSCARSSIEEQGRWADVVFTGTLVGKEPTPGAYPKVRYTFDVAQVYDGAATPSTDVVSSGGAMCGVRDLREGRSYVVFAHGGDDGLTTGLCSGTRAAGAAYVDRVEAALGAGSPPVAGSADDQDDSGGASDGWGERSGPLALVAGIAALVILGALAVGGWRAAHGRTASTRA